MASEELIYSRIRQQAFDGAATNYRMEQKGLIIGEADKLAERELQLLWARSHHAVRNNGLAKAAKREYVQNLNAISVKWKSEDGKMNKKMQNIWNEFAANPNLDGYGTLANTQEGWNASMFETGEALCRMLIKRRNKFSIPLVLQNIEPEYLDPTYTGGDPENTRNSITFADGRPSIYHFSKKLGLFGIRNDGEKIKVPADEVLHIFVRERANQWRGIPMLAPILMPLYELDDLTDATIAKQKAAQAISWIVKNTNPTSAVAIGAASLSLDENDVDESGKRRVITQASGGGTQYLNQGEDIAFYQGTDIGGNLIDLIKYECRKIAQAAGLTYTALTGDLTELSFSALQQAAIEMKTRAEFIYNFYIINLGLAPLAMRFQELATLYGNKSFANLKPVYQFPRRYGVNDLKDAQADVLEVDGNIGLLQDKLAERDITFEELLDDLDKRILVSQKTKVIKENEGPKQNTNTQQNNTRANSNSAGQ